MLKFTAFAAIFRSEALRGPATTWFANLGMYAAVANRFDSLQTLARCCPSGRIRCAGIESADADWDAGRGSERDIFVFGETMIDIAMAP